MKYRESQYDKAKKISLRDLLILESLYDKDGIKAIRPYAKENNLRDTILSHAVKEFKKQREVASVLISETDGLTKDLSFSERLQIALNLKKYTESMLESN